MIAGPPSVSADSFPAANFNVPLRLREGSKGFNVATGVLTRKLASPGAFLVLGEVGALGVVTKGTLLYVKTDNNVDIQITTDDGSGGSVVGIIPIYGFTVIEFSSTRFLKLLEAKGTAAIEYFVSGLE